jgi:hypothetical protein
MANQCKKCNNCLPYGENKVYCIECEGGTPCFVKYSSDCVIYEGDDLECFGISSGTNLTDVILNLLALVFPECHTTTTTSTTSTSTSTTSTSTSTTSTTTICLTTTSTTTDYKICKTCP